MGLLSDLFTTACAAQSALQTKKELNKAHAWQWYNKNIRSKEKYNKIIKTTKNNNDSRLLKQTKNCSSNMF